MFRFESMNGKLYDVLSYDNERALTLLYEVNDSMENTYLVVENMKNNGLIWAKEHSFTNYKEAHNYFVIEVYNALDYKEQFRNVLKQEEINLEGVSFDMLYAYFMEDHSTSGFIDRQYIEDLISDVKENEKEGKEVNNFLDDEEKMRDFHVLSKEEFLNTYSYIKDEEYEATQIAVGKGLHLTNETLNKTILEKTINVFNQYRIVKPENENDKGIYVVLTDDKQPGESFIMSYDKMKEIIPEAEQYYYTSYGDALNNWTEDIKLDINDLGLFPNENGVYDFYLTPEELQYCGLEKEIRAMIDYLGFSEKENIAYITTSPILLDILSKDTNSSIRLEVAKNRNASHETLNELALDSSKEISQNAQKTEIAKYNAELEHIKKYFENDRVEYFIYHREKQELQVIWFNEDGNDGLGTIRVDYYPYSDIIGRNELNKINGYTNETFYGDFYYDENYDKFQHELITDLSKIDDLLFEKNAIKINTDTLTIADVIKMIDISNQKINLSEVKQEKKQGLSHIKGLGTTSEQNKSGKEKLQEQER